jgi:hypothetical protein
MYSVAEPGDSVPPIEAVRYDPEQSVSFVPNETSVARMRL